MTDRAFTDEELTAYLDGEAAPDVEASISSALETDEGLAERLAGLDIPIAAIRQRYDDVLTDAPPMPELSPAVPSVPQGRGFPRVIMGAGLFGTGIAAGLAVAVFTGLGQPQPQEPGWKAMVANYQLLYGKSTLYATEPQPADVSRQLIQVSAALGLDLNDLPVPAGYSFKRAQILEFKGRPLAQISYTLPDGTPVALCILSSKNPTADTVDLAVIQGLGSASWVAGGYGYLLIGGENAEVLAPPAETFKDWSLTAT